MAFRIEITETKIEPRTVGKDWKVIAQKCSEDEAKALDVYGYTPEIEKLQVISTKVYEQTVDSLDLVKVISAVNAVE